MGQVGVEVVIKVLLSATITIGIHMVSLKGLCYFCLIYRGETNTQMGCMWYALCHISQDEGQT